jgi:hypothetical protein
MRALVLCAGLSLICAAQTSVSAPMLGIVRDCAGQIRRVFGVGGAFRLGPAEDLALPPEPADARIEAEVLVLRRGGEAEKRIPLPGKAAALHHMGPGWLAAAPFALKLTADGAIVYRLPMKGCAR